MQIKDIDGSVSVIEKVYRVQKDHTEPVKLYVGRDRKVWIGYGKAPTGFSLAGFVDGEVSRVSACKAANCW